MKQAVPDYKDREVQLVKRQPRRCALATLALAHLPLLEKAYAALMQRCILQNAAALHVLKQEEAADTDRFGVSGRAVVIPNGVNPDEYHRYTFRRSPLIRRVLYGRFGPPGDPGEG